MNKLFQPLRSIIRVCHLLKIFLISLVFQSRRVRRKPVSSLSMSTISKMKIILSSPRLAPTTFRIYSSLRTKGISPTVMVSYLLRTSRFIA